MTRHSRFTAIVFLLTLAAGMAFHLALAGEKKFIASKLRAPFHHVWCRYAVKITPQNAVYFETREEAIQAGHRSCKVCKP